MRKFIVCLFALFVVGNATAETMCVKLDASKSCSHILQEPFESNWTTTCDGVVISGVSYCSNQVANNTGDKSDNVTMSSALGENIYCWCKMIIPAVSSWVYSDDAHGGCEHDCAYNCVYFMAFDSDFRSALFSDLH